MGNIPNVNPSFQNQRTSDKRKICKFEPNCYRRNRDHLMKYSHPSKEGIIGLNNNNDNRRGGSAVGPGHNYPNNNYGNPVGANPNNYPNNNNYVILNPATVHGSASFPLQAPNYPPSSSQPPPPDITTASYPLAPPFISPPASVIPPPLLLPLPPSPSSHSSPSSNILTFADYGTPPLQGYPLAYPPQSPSPPPAPPVFAPSSSSSASSSSSSSSFPSSSAISAKGGGLTRVEFDRFMPFPFRQSQAREDPCPMCLAEYEEGEMVVLTPCFHKYHCDCLSNWVAESCICPICKKDLKNV